MRVLLNLTTSSKILSLSDCVTPRLALSATNRPSGWACAHIPLVLYERADAITALNDLEDFGGNWTVTFDLEASRKKQLKRLSAAVQSGTKRPLTLTFPNGRDRISGLAC